MIKENKIMNEEQEKMIIELYNDLMEEKKNGNKIPCGNVAITESIQVGRFKWSAFSYNEVGNVLFLLNKEYDIKTRFGDNNNYLISDARKTANECEPSKRALEIFGEDAFVPISIDLFSQDGAGTYGICDGDLFGVMNYDMYRTNYANIKKSGMLLSTPRSLVGCSGEVYVLYINSYGDVDYIYVRDRVKGVRPFFILKSDILVSLVK